MYIKKLKQYGIADKKYQFNLNKSMFLTFIAMLLNVAVVYAENDFSPNFSFSGFGTLGVVHSTENQADFTNSVFKPNGAGHTREWAIDVDSLIGVQLTANLTPKLSAVAQVIAEHQYDNTYTPEFEWANLKYAFTSDFSVRIGRVALPSFMVSDYRKVGYANPWVRPPLEVYTLVPITKNDGIDVSYRKRFGEVTNTLQALYGGLTIKQPGGSKVKGRNQWGIYNTTEYGPLTVRMSYYRVHATVQSTIPLFNAFRQFGAEGIAIADKFSCDSKRNALTSLGVSYDPGNWFLMGELTRRETNCFVDENTAGYISAGYRIGKFTPYITYAQVIADGITDSGLSAGAFVPAAATLNTQLSELLASSPDQKTFSIGARWNFMKNTALKFQYDHSRLGASGSPGVLKNPQAGFQSGGSFNVFSATIDFVF